VLPLRKTQQSGAFKLIFSVYEFLACGSSYVSQALYYAANTTLLDFIRSIEKLHG
jgi:hypothetical protein